MKRRHFANFHIAGFTYNDGPVIFNELKIGTILQLQRDANNQYDAKAVAINYGEHKLGYIPRNENDAISKLLEQGYSDIFEVRIQSINPTDNPEQQVKVIVYLLPFTK
jgi:hypothetical protein